MRLGKIKDCLMSWSCKSQQRGRCSFSKCWSWASPTQWSGHLRDLPPGAGDVEGSEGSPSRASLSLVSGSSCPWRLAPPVPTSGSSCPWHPAPPIPGVWFLLSLESGSSCPWSPAPPLLASSSSSLGCPAPPVPGVWLLLFQIF